MVAIQSAPGLNRGLSYVMCKKKHVFVKKNVYKWVKHGFTIINLSQKDSP